MLRPRVAALLSSLVQVSVITNSASAPTPSTSRSGNHQYPEGASAKSASTNGTEHERPEGQLPRAHARGEPGHEGRDQ
jgi:hypothetical protein